MTAGAGSGTLKYDPLGRLLSVGAAGQAGFGYDGLDLVGEYASDGSLLRRYVHVPGIDRPIVWYEGAGTSDRRYLHGDERGSIVAVTNNAGTSIANNTYDAWGIPGSANVGRFGYTGQVWLPEIGMWYYKVRMYSPTLGRFMQTDPIGYADGMNWYAYVGHDPVNKTDPLGLFDTPDPNDTIVVTARREEGATFAARRYSLEKVLWNSNTFQQITTGRDGPIEYRIDVANVHRYPSLGYDKR